jgi:hypothetical protein
MSQISYTVIYIKARIIRIAVSNLRVFGDRCHAKKKKKMRKKNDKGL